MKRWILAVVAVLLGTAVYERVTLYPPSPRQLLVKLPSLSKFKSSGCRVSDHWKSTSTQFFDLPLGSVDMMALKVEMKDVGWINEDGRWIKPIRGFPPSRGYLSIKVIDDRELVSVGTATSKPFGLNL